MTVEEFKQLKSALKTELARRNGIGSVAKFAGSKYDITAWPEKGKTKMKPEFGEKSIDLILQILDYKDLRLTKVGEPVPTAFNKELITLVQSLSKEESTGESEKTVKELYPSRKPETSSCRGMCTGLCVGTCTGHCNGCTSCTASCGTGCASGCNSTCKGGAMKEVGD